MHAWVQGEHWPMAGNLVTPDADQLARIQVNETSDECSQSCYSKGKERAESRFPAHKTKWIRTHSSIKILYNLVW
jgi:hypothetical protein